MSTDAKSPQLRLLHPSLSQLPLQVRFIINGLIGNVLFIVMYNVAVAQFEHLYAPSAIYSVVYFVYIPLGHALSSLIVFGWPDRYLKSLLSNYPIGLTAIAIGATCTSYLDRVGFNEAVEDMIRDHMTWFGFDDVATDEDEKGEFYSSLLVLVITTVWSYVLSVMVNAPPEVSEEKKEL